MNAYKFLPIAVIGFFCLLLTLGACDKNPASEEKPPATITGTLILPAPAEGKTFIVAVDDNSDAEDGFTKVKVGTCGDDTTQTYTIEDVSSGTYYLYAVVWVVSDTYATPESGDFVGYYGMSGAIPEEPNAVVPETGTVQFDITLLILP